MNLSLQLAALCVASMVLLPAVISDLRYRRIPNYVSVIGALGGITLHLIFSGLSGGALALASGFMLLIAMFPFFAIGWMGAGDVKLIAAVGIIGGSFMTALSILLSVVIAGAVLALVVIAWQRGLKEFIKRSTSSITTSFITRIPVYETAPDNVSSRELPYAIAIAIGTVFVLGLSYPSII